MSEVSRRTNQTGALGVSGSGTTLLSAIRIDVAAYDALPPILRDTVARNAIKLSAESVLKFWRSIIPQTGGDDAEAARYTAAKIEKLEAGEISMFAGWHRGAHGYDLPHVASRATICRPDTRRARIIGWDMAA
jgi:hypothetical protein